MIFNHAAKDLRVGSAYEDDEKEQSQTMLPFCFLFFPGFPAVNDHFVDDVLTQCFQKHHSVALSETES